MVDVQFRHADYVLLLACSLLVACAPDAGKSEAPSLTTRPSAVDIVQSVSAFRARLEPRPAPALNGEQYELPATNTPRARVRASVPRRADRPVRLEAVADRRAWIEVGARGMRPVDASVERGALVYAGARADTDVVVVMESERIEELWVLRSPSSPATVRYGLRTGPGIARVRERGGRIEAVDPLGAVRFRTGAAFAVDARGRQRGVELALEGNGQKTLVASVDTSGLEFPIVVDPEWVVGPEWPSQVVVGLERVDIDKDVQVTGDVVVVDASEQGHTELTIDKDSVITGTIQADEIRLKQNTTVTGDIHFNQLHESNGSIGGSLVTPLPLPLNVSVPAFPVPAPGVADVEVDKNDTETLAAGVYRDVELQKGSASDPTVLQLTGGLYEFASFDAKQYSRLECLGPCEVRVAGTFRLHRDSYVGPAPSAAISEADVEVYVHDATGAAAHMHQNAVLRGRFFVPNGTLQIDKESDLAGSFVAARVDIDKDTVVAGVSCDPGNVDDGNPCTVDSCTPSGPLHEPAPPGTSCSDGDLCNGDETCDGAGSCQAGTPPTVDDGNPCTADSCDPATGVQHDPEPAGTACADGNLCNGDETCDGTGSCQAGTPPTVDDGNPCTADSCDPATGVQHDPEPVGTACADGNLCNGDETCDGAGSCQGGTPPPVDDGNPCTADSCDPATGVQHDPEPAGTACADGNLCNGDETCDGVGSCQGGTPPPVDDGNPCTVDSCDPATGVQHDPEPAGTACADGDLCNGDETCDGAGSCQGGTPPPVDDGNPCTADSCDPATGVQHDPEPAGTACADGDLCNGDETCDGAGSCQAGTPPTVDDGNPCTADSCDPATGVQHDPEPAGTACADGDLCNGDETCDGAGSCQAGTPPILDDGNPCTIDVCDPVTGVAHLPEPSGLACPDGDLCNGDETCDGAGACQAGTLPVVDDGNPCTADSCDPVAGVQHDPEPAGTACADGDLCNGDETCDGAGSCQAGTPPAVDDGNPCTADSCDPATGVQHDPEPAGTACADGDLCNGDETCDGAGSCQAGTPPAVDDGNPCTADSCDPATGVQHDPEPAGTACADGDLCNGDETCDGAGACQAGTPPAVDDGNPCTADSCDPATGVQHDPEPAGTACADGDLCNGDETCDGAGVCQAGTPPPVDDGNPCTIDACDPQSGVVHLPEPSGLACPDGDLCNGDEACDGAGACQAGTPPVVDDGNPCTADSCDPATGVQHDPEPAGTACADGDLCNGGETCDGAGSCQAGTPPPVDDGNPCTADSCDPVAGVQHDPEPAGLSCADGDVCNGDETCDGAGTCVAGAPLPIDDGDRCTVDGCDPISGVTHTSVPACDDAPSQQGGLIEERAALLGRATTCAGQPVTGYTIRVFDSPAVGPERTDIAVSTASDGSFHVRLTAFPTSSTDEQPPVRVSLRLEHPSFITAQRDVYLRPNDVINLDDIVLLDRDPQETVIGPSGGTATDSQGLFTVDFPPGAVGTNVSVRITPISDRKCFPAPMPATVFTMYGAVFEPEGIELAVPATVRIQNTLGVPTSLCIPGGSFDRVTGRWVPEDTATFDGTAFVGTLNRLSFKDYNASESPERRIIGFGIDEEPMICGGSELSAGSLSARVVSPGYVRQGREYETALTYASGFASTRHREPPNNSVTSFALFGGGSAQFSSVNPFTIPRLPTPHLPAVITASCSTDGACAFPAGPDRTLTDYEARLCVLGKCQSTIGPIDDSLAGLSLPADFAIPSTVDNKVPRAQYAPVRYQLTLLAEDYTLASCGPFGVMDSELAPITGVASAQPGPSIELRGYEFIPHRRGSPYGNGWAVSGVPELFRAPDGSRVDLLRDDCVETFRPKPSVSIVGTGLSTFNGRAQARDPMTGDHFLAEDTDRIVRINPGTGSAEFHASAALTGEAMDMDIAYFGGNRLFFVALTDSVIMVDDGGTSTVLYTYPNSSPQNNPAGVAAGNDFVYFTDRSLDIVFRIDLTDPGLTPVAITAGAGGDTTIEPTVPAASVAIRTPRGLALADDGGLYVASTRRHMVYKLEPQADGTAGPLSSVTRVVGNGLAAYLDLDRPQPGPEFAIPDPIQVSTAPDGTLHIGTTYGVAAWDPGSKVARWLAVDDGFDGRARIRVPLTQHFYARGNILADGARQFTFQHGGRALRVDASRFASTARPDRTVALDASGAILIDTQEDTNETYFWTDATRSHALLSERRGRPGELLLSASFVPGTNALSVLQDATGTGVTFSYGATGKLSSFSDPAGRTSTSNVDADGDLTQVDMPEGRSVGLTYSEHRIESETDVRGEATTYSHSSNGNYSGKSRPGGAASGLGTPPDTASGPEPGVHEGTLVDELGVVHAYTFDEFGEVRTETFTADGVLYQLENVPASQLSEVDGPITWLWPNEAGRVSHTLANGLQITPARSWDVQGRTTAIRTAPNSTVIGGATPQLQYAFEFNEDGRVTRVDPSATNVLWDTVFDASGRPSLVFDANEFSGVSTGRETSFTWRPDGQLDTSTERGVLTTTSYELTSGQLQNITDTLGRSTTFAYDAAGNTTAVDDGIEAVVSSYDDANRITSFVDGAGNIATYAYADGDLITGVETPDLPPGAGWTYAYDSDGNVTSVTDPTGAVASATYTPTGRIEVVIDPLLRQTTFQYDSLDRPSEITDRIGRKHRFAHPIPDSTGWQGFEVLAGSPDGAPPPTDVTATLRDGEWQMGAGGYRPGGFPADLEFYRDATFQLDFGRRYDRYSRIDLRRDRAAEPFLTLPALTATPGAFIDETFSFDINTTLAKRNLITADASTDLDRDVFFELSGIDAGWTTPTGATGVTGPRGTYTRDGLSRITQIDLEWFGCTSHPCTGAPLVQLPASTVVIYDAPGRIQQLTSGTGVQDFTYNSRGLVDTMTLSFEYVDPATSLPVVTTEGTFIYDYDDVGRNTQIDFPDGHRRVQSYDELGRVTSRCYEYAPPRATRCYTAEYDAVGNPLRLTDPEGESVLMYDDLDRVIEARRIVSGQPDEVETYAYNALGALSVHASSPVDHERSRLDGSGVASSGMPATHGGQPVVLNAGGNVDELLGVQLDRDGRGRIVRSDDAGFQLTFGRDSYLRRWATQSSTDTEYYLYADVEIESNAPTDEAPSNVVAVVDGAAQVRNRYLYDATDEPLWRFDAASLSTVYYELDAIGNVRRLRGGRRLDAGAVPLADDMGGYRYTAFGRTIPPDAGTPSPTIPNATTGVAEPYEQPLRWQGRWFIDVAGGLYDFRARTWSPEIGAFLELDAFEFLQPTGTYWSWPGQNPLALRDPRGRIGAFVGIGAVASQLRGVAASLARSASAVKTGKFIVETASTYRVIFSGGNVLALKAAQLWAKSGAQNSFIAFSKATGQAAEAIVHKWITSSGMQLVGRQVHVQTRNGLRIVDYLVNLNGKYYAIEVKGSLSPYFQTATKSSQRAADWLMRTEGGKILGKGITDEKALKALQNVRTKIATLEIALF